MIDKIDSVVNAIGGFLYQPYIVPLFLIVAGLYFTIRTGLIQFRLFGESIHVVAEKPKEKGSISSFGALMVSTASRVGTGNIVGACGAILVGGNTLHTDNPLLTARLDDPVERQPLAVSISSRVPAPDSLLLFKERPTETIFFTTASGAATPRAAQLRERGVRIRGLDRWKSGEDLVQILEYLRQEAGCPYVLCEGGGRLGLSLLEAGLVDEFHLHIAPKVLGDNDARPLFDGRTPLELDEALSLRLVRMEPCGEDGHLIFRPVRACSQA